jgi:hypothetical protein
MANFVARLDGDYDDLFEAYVDDSALYLTLRKVTVVLPDFLRDHCDSAIVHDVTAV